MYESPIKVNNLEFGPVISEGFEDDHSIHNIAKKAAESLTEQYDRYVLHQVALTGVTVDRDELIKALRYDRDQYTKGYHEGMERGIEISSPKRGHWIGTKEAEDMGDIMKEFTCSVCGCCEWDCTESESFNFCPNCGADMRGE